MNKDIQKFNEAIEQPELKRVCELLATEILKGLPDAEYKIWYSIPVWFIKGNPVVGYSLTKSKGINLLFWSGQAFDEPGLSPEGKFKAAEIKYVSVDGVSKAKLQTWLSEASQKIYNYKDIRKNRGELSLI
ncbi:MAG: hypothetical protein JWM52_210 [Candidatus Saccharibacteria bacterium]|nr:hypothetical protein [Candidatus Saccharibacteria bacterium]